MIITRLVMIVTCLVIIITCLVIMNIIAKDKVLFSEYECLFGLWLNILHILSQPTRVCRNFAFRHTLH